MQSGSVWSPARIGGAIACARGPRKDARWPLRAFAEHEPASDHGRGVGFERLRISEPVEECIAKMRGREPVEECMAKMRGLAKMRGRGVRGQDVGKSGPPIADCAR